MSSNRSPADSSIEAQRSACACARFRTTEGGATASPGAIRRGPAPFPRGAGGGGEARGKELEAEHGVGPAPRTPEGPAEARAVSRTSAWSSWDAAALSAQRAAMAHARCLD